MERGFRVISSTVSNTMGDTVDSANQVVEPRSRRATGRACLALAALVALTSCGSNDSSDDPAGTGTTISPLAELMGWQNDSPEESRRKQLQVEDLTAECMREEGWEYTPVDWSAQMPDQEVDNALMNDPEAFGKKYGYGVVHNYEQWEEPQLRGEEGGVKEPGPIVTDPNQEYVSQLSPSESEEYYKSLYGGGMDVPASTIAVDGATEESTDEVSSSDGEFATAPANAAVAVPVRPEDQGCSGRANAEVYGADPMQSNPDLQERMNEYWEDSQNDPRLLAAGDAWAECMAGTVDGLEAAGEPITKPEQMYSYLDRLKYEAMGLEIVPFDQDDPDQQYYTAWTDDSGTGEAAVGEPSPIPEDALEELRQIELDLWAKDWGCQEDADIADIRRQIEQELVDELRAEFPELGGGES